MFPKKCVPVSGFLIIQSEVVVQNNAAILDNLSLRNIASNSMLR